MFFPDFITMNDKEKDEHIASQRSVDYLMALSASLESDFHGENRYYDYDIKIHQRIVDIVLKY